MIVRAMNAITSSPAADNAIQFDIEDGSNSFIISHFACS
jgi:hypothetical protein